MVYTCSIYDHQLISLSNFTLQYVEKKEEDGKRAYFIDPPPRTVNCRKKPMPRNTPSTGNLDHLIRM